MGGLKVRRKLHVIFVTGGLIACPSFGVAQSAPEPKQTSLEQRVAQSIKDYDKWKGGLEKTPEIIARLKVQAESPDRHLGSEGWNAQETLAKLGDRGQLQNLVCELYAKDSQAQLDATWMMSFVGGYASIRALSKAMLGGPDYGDYPPGGYATLRMHALGALSKLITELEIPLKARFGIAPPDQQFRDWYDWIEEHRAELGKLQPSEGGDLGQSDCADLQRKKFSLRDVALIRITSSWSPYRGDKENIATWTAYNRHGKFFVGTESVNEIALATLVRAVTDPATGKPTLRDLGIDESWLASNAQAALDSLPAKVQAFNGSALEDYVLTREDRQQFLKLFGDMDSMNEVFQGNFYVSEGTDEGSARVGLEIELRGGETIRLWSRGAGLFLLPWTIGGQEYNKVFDYRLSQAVAKLLSRSAPNFEQLSGTGKYSLRRRLALGLISEIAYQSAKQQRQTNE
jgi:hypothetical protein